MFGSSLRTRLVRVALLAALLLLLCANAAHASFGSGPSVLLNQPGLTVNDFGQQPPDPTGAIGPNHYVEMVNSAIAVYDRKNLNLIDKAPLTPQTPAHPGFTSASRFVDPQIQWDEHGKRWLYAGNGPNTAANRSGLVVGWSKTSDPSDLNPGDGSSGWCQFVLDPPPPPSGTSTEEDYPKLGHSDSHIIIGVNIRVNGVDTHSRIWAIPKPGPGLINTCPAQTPFETFGDLENNPLRTEDGDLAFTPVPANTLESTDKGYIVAADNRADAEATADEIMVWHIQGPPNDPELVPDGDVAVTPYRQPSAAPQPPPGDDLNLPGYGPPPGPGIGTRLTAAVMASDPDAGGAKAIWTQHTIGPPPPDQPGGRAQARWYELLPGTTSDPTVRQQGTIASPDHWIFNPAISPTTTGNEAVINYNLSSTTQVPQIAVRTRRSDTPLGEMGGATIIATSDAPLVGSSRWGDYAGASPDPKNAHTVWGSNELAGPFPPEFNWETQNFAVSTGARFASFEDGQVVNPVTGFDSAVGQVSITSSVPTPYEGTKQLRAVYFPNTGPAQGRFAEALPTGSDVWYGGAFYLDGGFKATNGNMALM
jgi:hypothetical protein